MIARRSQKQSKFAKGLALCVGAILVATALPTPAAAQSQTTIALCARAPKQACVLDLAREATAAVPEASPGQPSRAQPWGAIVEAAIEVGRLDVADNAARRLPPGLNNRSFHIRYATALARAGRIADAEAFIRWAGLQLTAPELVGIIVSPLYGLGRDGEAEAYAARLVPPPTNNELAFARISGLADAGRMDELRAVLDGWPDAAEAGDIALHLASSLRNTSQAASALALLRGREAAFRRDPFNASMVVRAARAGEFVPALLAAWEAQPEAAKRQLALDLGMALADAGAWREALPFVDLTEGEENRILVLAAIAGASGEAARFEDVERRLSALTGATAIPDRAYLDALLRQGMYEVASRFITSRRFAFERDSLLQAAARHLAKRGDPQRAFAVARGVSTPEGRAYAFAALAPLMPP